ncbi:MAG: hypothetical protein NC432_14865 [Roseburia sp.]|nr:hypothetical protein [Roseburia sp.]MCM1096554.1 hypothetical protein [Ruminococcus flavefaciens]MCM1235298.1 hypothetical protein [Ruminococcus flavefaciens]
MKATSTNINKSMQTISVYLVHRISREYHCKEEEALKKLLKTVTYNLLQDRETGLYAESPEYIWQVFRDEENGNLETVMNE